MEEETWTPEKHLCRCCHAEGKFKNLADPMIDSDQEEIYSHMLKYCFDIDLLPVPGIISASTYTICDRCIITLQDALRFKKTVIACEEKFKEIFVANVVEVYKPKSAIEDVKIKEETPEYCHDDLSVGNDSDFDNSTDYGLVEEGRITRTNKTGKTSQKTMDIEVNVKKKSKQNNLKSRTIKAKGTKRNVKAKKDKISEDKGAKEKDEPPKFRLSEGDYTIDGTTFACTRCDKRYDKIFSLKFHVKTKHYKIPRHICPYCKKEFMTPAPLTVHKLEQHNVDDRFKCNACKGTFNTKVQLRKHINNFHMLGVRFSCGMCEYESFSFESMYKHKFKHKTSKDHHCKYCKKSFVRKTTLDLHVRIHTGDRRKVCTICGQAFVQKASLNYHMTKYHPEVNY